MEKQWRTGKNCFDPTSSG